MIETIGDDRRFPPALAAVAEAEFDYDDGEGIDFEPYGAFDSAEETTDWIRHWTGNHELDGDAVKTGRGAYIHRSGGVGREAKTEQQKGRGQDVAVPKRGMIASPGA